MAESVVSFLLETLTPLMVEEVSLLKNVRKALMEIKDEFSSMQALLKDADAKEEGDHRVKAWLKEVRDVAYETEDVIDEFVLLHHHPQQPHGSCGSLIDQLQSIGRLSKNMKRRSQVAHQIQEIKRKVKEISRRKKDYSLGRWEQGSTSRTLYITQQHDPREDALFIKDAQLVGINESREKLIQWLVDVEKNSSLGIVSVYGEGGLGKTTLVKKVFDSQTVMANFPYRLWITVSQTFEIKTLLQDLIKQLLNEAEKVAMREELYSMDATKLKVMLQDRLGGERYVVVLDDIWKLDAWKSLQNAFPDGIGCGSRIIVTTRFHNIARECLSENYGLDFKLERLTLEDALKLFCKKALALDDVNNLPIQLRELSQNFLHKCKGLPLAIVSIAGLLRTKEPTEWNHVYENFGYMMKTNEKLKDLNLILSLSYSDLPFHLKSCFLYLCIFPTDHSIKCKKLFRLWVAEGFVERKPGMGNSMTKEDIANGYLDDLINRSLVQAEEQDVTGRVKTCQVHDILREFILSKAHEQDFAAHLFEQQNDRGELQGPMIGRRLSVFNASDIQNPEVLLHKKRSFSHLRSFFLFSKESIYSTIPCTIFSSFKLLKVLDLDFIRIGKFPSEIVNLFNLRYLSIGGEISSIPSSLGKLTNLEILYMRTASIIELPKDILTLKRLRYLVIGGSFFDGMRLPVGVEKLTNLEKLSAVGVNGAGSSDMVRGLGMLTQMRSLVIRHLTKEDGIQLFASVEKMKYLRSFSVMSDNYGLESLDVQNIWSPPTHLKKLDMHVRLPTCPPWFSKLQNLVKLRLYGSKVKDDSLLRDLQTLPNLAELILWDAIDREDMSFQTGGFLRLQQLTIHYLMNLTMVNVEEGAMPSIQLLRFIICPKLEKVPLGIDHLITLRSIHIEGMLLSIIQIQVKDLFDYVII